MPTKDECASNYNPTIQLKGASDVYDAALQNATAFGDLLTSLENRLGMIEKNQTNNTISIGNTKYSELIIDISDPQTFDFNVYGSSPIVTAVGSNPQKLKFVLPQGPPGDPGDRGPTGPDYYGQVFGNRGPPGPISANSALPEQWTTSAYNK